MAKKRKKIVDKVDEITAKPTNDEGVLEKPSDETASEKQMQEEDKITAQSNESPGKALDESGEALEIEEDESDKESPATGKKITFFKWFVHELAIRQILQKILTLAFALVVFAAVYYYMSKHQSILTYMGTMLLMVMVYAEILVIRDHLWVIEGSMRESRKWRDVFFNQSSMKRQRLRKLYIMLFAMMIFSVVYIKAIRSMEIISFLGVILMITVLYYEILSIRDEVHVMSLAIEAKKELDSEMVKMKKKELENAKSEEKE